MEGRGGMPRSLPRGESMIEDNEINNTIRTLKARGLSIAAIANSLQMDEEDVRRRLQSSYAEETLDYKATIVQAKDQYDVLFAELGTTRLGLEHDIEKKSEAETDATKDRQMLMKIIEMQTGLLDKKVKLMADLGDKAFVEEAVSFAVTNSGGGSTPKTVQPRWDMEALSLASMKYEDSKHWKLWGCINVLYDMGFKDKMDKVQKSHRLVVLKAFELAGREVNDSQVSYAVTCSKKYGEKLPDETPDDGMPSYDEMLEERRERNKTDSDIDDDTD
jgi:hypothetical protein